MKSIFYLYVIFCLVSSVNLSYSQEINANVIVNMDQLQQEARNYVSTLNQDLTRYINSQKFTNIEWKTEPIPVEITIYLSGGNNNKYSAKLFIIAKRKLESGDSSGGYSVLVKMKDERWSFEYSYGSNLSYNTMRFDEFTSLLDFYMLLIIGLDRDLYGELDGSQAFDKAKNIVLLGASKGADGYQTTSPPGEFTRYNLMNELTDLRFEELRKLFFAYYYDGLDKLANEKETALRALDEIVYNLALFKQNKTVGSSVLMQLFFDTKAPELANIFKEYQSKYTVYKNLIYLDPGNTMLYEDTRDGKR